MKPDNLILESELPFDGGIGYSFQAREGFPIYTKSKIIYDSREGIYKWKAGLSLTSGCAVRCSYCYTQNMNHFYPLSCRQIVDQARFVFEHPIGNYDTFKIDLKTMGDPLLNSLNTLEAISEFCILFSDSSISVSTSGPNDPVFSNPDRFFYELRKIRDRNSLNDIRLQFSCHSTSDEYRKKLHAHVPVLSLEEIASVCNKWYTGDRSDKVTLNFVPFQDYNLNVSELARIFNPDQVLIKISYVDENEFTLKNNLANAASEVVNEFTQDLTRYGFDYALRLGISSQTG